MSLMSFRQPSAVHLRQYVAPPSETNETQRYIEMHSYSVSVAALRNLTNKKSTFGALNVHSPITSSLKQITESLLLYGASRTFSPALSVLVKQQLWPSSILEHLTGCVVGL